MTRHWLALLVYWPLWLRAALGPILYDNTAKESGSRYALEFETGNELTLAGTERLLGRVEFPYVSLMLDDPAKQCVVRIYANDGPAGAPQTLLYQSPGIPVRGYTAFFGEYYGVAQIDLNVPARLPDRFTLTFQTIGLELGDQVAIPEADPPVTGTCAPHFWRKNVAGEWTKLPRDAAMHAKFALRLTAGGGLSLALAPLPNFYSRLAEGPPPPYPVDVTFAPALEASLRFEATSSNPDLIAASDVTIEKRGEERWLYLNPKAGKTGSAVITLSVTDGFSRASVTFKIEVTNPLPILAIRARQNGIEPDQPAVFAFSLSERTAEDLIVSFTVSGTARPGKDYEALTGKVLIPAWSSDFVLAIPVLDDQENELAETLTLQLEPSAAFMVEGEGKASVTISDDDSWGSAPPFIVFPPGNTVAFEQEEYMFTVVAEGTAPLTYQWLRNGVPLPEQTLNVLFLRNAKLEDSGEYTVVVGSPTGTTSAAAQLAVLPLPMDGNARPKIEPTFSFVMDASNPSQNVPISASDPDTGPDRLRLRVTSSDPRILDPARVTVQGQGTPWMVNFKPTFQHSGQTVIGYIVTDDHGRSAIEPAYLRTHGSNETAWVKPELGALTDQAVARDKSLNLPFTVSVPEPELARLTLTGRSSNPALVPNRNLVFSGTGSNRVLTVTPQKGDSGRATITVIAGGANMFSSQKSFILEVGSFSSLPPSISTLLPVSVYPWETPPPVRFEVSDPDDDPATLTVEILSSNPSLVAAEDITILGTGKDRELRLAPRPGQTGYSVIQVFVTDPSLRKTISAFVFRVLDAVRSVVEIESVKNAIEPDQAGGFTITRSGPIEEPLVVSFTLGGSALIGQDYDGWYRTATIPAGARQMTLEVRPFDNPVPQADQTVVLQLEPGRAYLPGTNDHATLFIADDDSLGTQGPVILVQPRGQTVFTEEDVMFGVLAEGLGPLFYQWRHNGTLLPGQTNEFLFLRKLTAAQSGEYTVVISSFGGRSVSAPGTLNVTPAPPGNSRPTITTSPSMVIEEDYNPSPSVYFSVRDNETPDEGLKVTLTSSDPRILNVNNIVLGRAGTQRTAQLFPSFARIGRTALFIYVTDSGGRTAFDGIFVYVTPAAYAPPEAFGVLGLVDQRVGINQGITVPFEVAGSELSAANLILHGQSSNAALAPNRNISFGGSGKNRTITLFPRTNATGNATITVSAGIAGGPVTQKTFQLSVREANQPPIIGPIPDLLLFRGGSPQALLLSVSDRDTAPDRLRIEITSSDVELLSPDDVRITGSETNRQLIIKPPATRLGSARLTVTVKDEEGAATSMAFSVTIGRDPAEPVVALGIQSSRGQLLLSWPRESAEAELQSCADLGIAAWVSTGLKPLVLGNQFVVILPTNEAARFFRLRYPR